MPAADVIREGERIMTICNACRYCEGFCAVFPAMEGRRSFLPADMHYLASLCHNCTECLHACQYAPPHPFAVNVPRTFAEIRLRSYEEHCWPRALAASFRRNGVATVFGVALTLAAVMGALVAAASPQANGAGIRGDFYVVISHGVMVGTFGAVFLFALLAMAMSVGRYRRATGDEPGTIADALNGIRNALTLKYLHGSGADCPTEERQRVPWRRWFHHLTFYGFALCFASTTVAAVYHLFGWRAPYALSSVPVVLGSMGGTGLVVGPLGLWSVRQRRDPATLHGAQAGLDGALIAVLVAVSATGLALLAFRETPAMRALLVAHLAFVMTCFVMLPYGKFVHGLYRTVALIRFSRESRAAESTAQRSPV